MNQCSYEIVPIPFVLFGRNVLIFFFNFSTVFANTLSDQDAISLSPYRALSALSIKLPTDLQPTFDAKQKEKKNKEKKRKEG